MSIRALRHDIADRTPNNAHPSCHDTSADSDTWLVPPRAHNDDPHAHHPCPERHTTRPAHRNPHLARPDTGVPRQPNGSHPLIPTAHGSTRLQRYRSLRRLDQRRPRFPVHSLSFTRSGTASSATAIGPSGRAARTPTLEVIHLACLEAFKQARTTGSGLSGFASGRPSTCSPSLKPRYSQRFRRLSAPRPH